MAAGTVPDGQQWPLAPALAGGFMLASKLLATGDEARLVMDIESTSFALGAMIKSKLSSGDRTPMWVTGPFVPPPMGL